MRYDNIMITGKFCFFHFKKCSKRKSFDNKNIIFQIRWLTFSDFVMSYSKSCELKFEITNLSYYSMKKHVLDVAILSLKT